MRVQYTLPDSLCSQLRERAESLRITQSRLVELYLAQAMLGNASVTLTPDVALPAAKVSTASAVSQPAVTQAQLDRCQHAPLRPGAALWEGSSEAEGYFVCCERCGTTLTPERHDGMKHLDCPADGLGAAR